MKEESIETIKKQHLETYHQAILDIIQNNSRALVDDDMASLLGKPPLDSMDSIQNKFISLARKNKIVLHTENLSSLLDNYRSTFLKCIEPMKEKRIQKLSKIVEERFSKEEDTFLLYKKDFVDINKELKKILKEQFLISLDQCILKNISSIFDKMTPDSIQESMTYEVTRFLKGNYQKQLLESFDIKVLVKDTTLINIVKEQAERYIFTLNNSRILNDIK